MSVIAEFKSFIDKGNVIQLAVGVVMGVAFGAVTKSLVDDMLMPPIGLVLGGVDFSSLVITLRDAEADGTGLVQIRWGMFVQTIVNFLIVAASLFMIVKIYDRLTKKAAQAAPVVAPSEEVLLLREIRDSLRQRS